MALVSPESWAVSELDMPYDIDAMRMANVPDIANAISMSRVICILI